MSIDTMQQAGEVCASLLAVAVRERMRIVVDGPPPSSAHEPIDNLVPHAPLFHDLYTLADDDWIRDPGSLTVLLGNALGWAADLILDICRLTGADPVVYVQQLILTIQADAS